MEPCACRHSARKLAVQPELLLVAHDEGAVIGTAMAGYDGHRGWLYAVAVRPDRQREGIGTLLLCRWLSNASNGMGCAKDSIPARSALGNEAVAAFYSDATVYEVDGGASAWS